MWWLEFRRVLFRSLIDTGLLGAVDNEAQLAFVLSHEIAHVLQVHQRREVEETRGKRIGLIIAGVAAGALIWNSGLFMGGGGIPFFCEGHPPETEKTSESARRREETEK